MASHVHVVQISYACRADIVLMSPNLVDKLVPGSASFHNARSDEKWRHIHDVCTSLSDTSTTSARHEYEMKTRTRILNRLKFSPLLAEYLRHAETSLRYVKTFVRVPHDTWRVIASYNSQQLVAKTRDSVTGALPNSAAQAVVDFPWILRWYIAISQIIYN